MREMMGDGVELFSLTECLEDRCEHEAEVVKIGQKLKSRCQVMNAWTNCREVKHCTLNDVLKLDKEAVGQLE